MKNEKRKDAVALPAAKLRFMRRRRREQAPALRGIESFLFQCRLKGGVGGDARFVLFPTVSSIIFFYYDILSLTSLSGGIKEGEGHILSSVFLLLLQKSRYKKQRIKRSR